MNENFNLAKTFFEQGEINFAKEDFENAEKNFQTSLNLLPNRISTLINLGLTKIKLRKLIECNEIIKLIGKDLKNLENIDFLNLKSLYFGETNNFEEAEVVLNSMLSFSKKLNNTKLSEIFSYKGIVYSQLGKHEKSISFQKKAIEIDNGNILAKFNLGIQNLKLANFIDGWKYYEYRIKKNKLPTLKYPKNINDIKSKKVLIRSEQGFGDIIQFSRFLKLIEGLTDEIDFLIPKGLDGLFKFNKAKTIFIKEKNYDYEIYLCSIPFLFNVSEDDIAGLSYDNFNTIKTVETKVLEDKKIKIGLAWSGKSSYPYDYLRSFTLEEFKPLFNEKKLEFYCLQKDIRNQDLDYFNKLKINNLGNLSFSQIANEMLNLDMVISSCTSLLHLASSLNVKTWAMLPYSSDWRWIESRTTSPWYKNLKIYQKNKKDSWFDLVVRIKSDLKKEFGL